MKTLNLFRVSLSAILFLMVFFGTISNSYSQCPTVSNPSPSICNASNFTFADLNTYATGSDIVWYDADTGGNAFVSSQLVDEGTYYAGDSTGSCGTRESITVDFVVDPSGQNLDGIFCDNENPTIQLYIDDVLQPNFPMGGSVQIFSDPELTVQPNNSDALAAGATNYFIVFLDSSGCKSQVEFGSTAVFSAPADPNPANPQEFCSDTNPTIADLDPGTTESYSWYENVDGMGMPIPPALVDSTPLVDGATYYIQINDIFCFSNTIPVNVIINDPVQPGTSATLDYCFNNIPASDFNLFDELGGTPDTTGTWSGPLSTSNGHLGTVNISSLTTAGTYVFTYSVPQAGVCPEGSSSVTIIIHDILSSGIPSANNPASFCQAELPATFDLFSLLDNEDPGGTWTQGTSSSDPAVASPIDLTGLTPGTYDFTYSQNVNPLPCPEENTTVQVIVLEDPNAGVAINQTFCENDLISNSPFDLFTALDGSQDDNLGEWTDSSGTTISNPIEITGFTVAGSPYVFTYTIDNGTCIDTEDISITIEPAPESGNALSPFEVCEENLAANSPFDLFTLLDGTQDTNGTWYEGLDTSGAVVTNPVDISGLSDGTFNYTYSVPVIGTCSDVDITVQIIVNATPNTGVPTPALFCENDLAANSPLDLFGQLSGYDAGGTWTDDNSSGALSGTNVDLTVLTIGSYNFTYSITSTNGCSNSSTVTVTIEDAPESGAVNPAAVFCASEITSGQTVDLFDLLEGEDQTGVWNDDTPSNALIGNIVTIDGLAPGTYNFTYDVNAIGTCDDILVTASIIINDTPAPTASATQEFCDSATVADLSATGNNIQWYDEATGGTALSSTTTLVDGENYFATQTDATTGCESSVRFEVTVVINPSPNSGMPNATPITVCDNNNSVDLNSGLDGTQDTSGSWIDTDGTGALSDNIFDATLVTAGTYQFTYTVNATPPCVNSSTVITVTVEETVFAGNDAVLDVCNDNGTTDLFALLGGADSGGTWSPALSSGTNTFDPTIDASGTYTYTISNSCSTDSSEVVISITPAPDAGADGSASLCVVDGIVDLTTYLGGTPDSSGTWSPALTSGTNDFDPTMDLAGVYTYTVTATSPCSMDASSQITVTINDSSAPTIAASDLSFCLADNPTVDDLNSTVVGTSINWYEDATATTPLDLTTALIDGEDYFATQVEASGCESSLRLQVNVTINDVATPTLVSNGDEFCISDAPTLLELTENIVEYDSNENNLVWYDNDVASTPLDLTTLLSNNSTYYASLLNPITGCESSIRLPVTVDLTDCDELVFPDGFSPNNDAVNDTYHVENLAFLHPDFVMEIYNRYGNMVYKGNANTPLFDGTSNRSRLVSKGELPVGVYFYIVEFNDGTKTKQGRFYLSR